MEGINNEIIEHIADRIMCNSSCIDDAIQDLFAVLAEMLEIDGTYEENPDGYNYARFMATRIVEDNASSYGLEYAK